MTPLVRSGNFPNQRPPAVAGRVRLRRFLCRLVDMTSSAKGLQVSISRKHRRPCASGQCDHIRADRPGRNSDAPPAVAGEHPEAEPLPASRIERLVMSATGHFVRDTFLLSSILSSATSGIPSRINQWHPRKQLRTAQPAQACSHGIPAYQVPPAYAIPMRSTSGLYPIILPEHGGAVHAHGVCSVFDPDNRRC